MTDEIKTVLSTTFPPHPLMSFHFPLLLLSGCSHPAAAVTSPQWLHIFALASHSSTEARTGPLCGKGLVGVDALAIIDPVRCKKNYVEQGHWKSVRCIDVRGLKGNGASPWLHT